MANSKRFNPKLLVIGAVLGASLALTGCNVVNGVVDTASGNTKQDEDKKAEQATMKFNGTPLQGTGKTVKTDRGSYEKISLDKNDSVWKYQVWEGKAFKDSPAASASWTEKEASEAQRLAIEYVAYETLDSKALDGGADGYNDWYANDAKKYFHPTVYQDPSLRDGLGKAVLDNFSNESMPDELIHDGKPRMSSLSARVGGHMIEDTEYGSAIVFGVDYDVAYRVDDANAAKLSGKHATGGPVSGKEFIASEEAQEQLKDGKGENAYHVTGQIQVYVAKLGKEFKIVGLMTDYNFDTSDFTQ